MPFLVEASLTRLALEPVVFCREPSVKNWKSGPRARVIAVLNGDITSSACFIVGAVGHTAAITDFARVWVWVALAVWLVVFAAMLRRAPSLAQGEP